MSVELTKKHKLYAGVLGLGLVALGLDRMMPVPSQAQAVGADYAVAAASSGASDSSSPGPAAMNGGGAGRHAPELSLADRLKGLSAIEGLDRDGIKEAFDPERLRQALRKAKGLVNNDAVLDASAFLVSSIMSGSSPAAIINGKLCFLGQIVPDGGEPAAGYRLVEIRSDRVVLDLNGHRFGLFLRSEMDELEESSDKGDPG